MDPAERPARCSFRSPVMEKTMDVLKERVARILQDEGLRDELKQMSPDQAGLLSPLRAAVGTDELREFVDSYSPEAALPGVHEFETIVLQYGRPVLLVRGKGFDTPTFDDPRSEVWRDRLAGARAHLEAAIPAVGRVEVQHHPTFDWLGTGWLVAPDIMVTNRHVAEVFAQRQGATFTFRQNFRHETMSGSVDFFEGYQQGQTREFRLEEVLYIGDDDGPDMAFFRVRHTGSSGQLADPISLATRPAEVGQLVAVIGYPAQDSRILDPLLMRRIFG